MSIQEREVAFEVAGGVCGRRRFIKAATKQTAAPQYIGRLVSSKAGRCRQCRATILKMPDATQPTEPNIRIRGNCSAGACCMAIVLVRLCVGMWQSIASTTTHHQSRKRLAGSDQQEDACQYIQDCQDFLGGEIAVGYRSDKR